MQYKLIVAILGLAIMAGAAGVVSAQADEGDHFQPLVKKIAQKFNLQEAEVQAVFDETKTEHMANMEAKFDDKLSEAVGEGDLTEAQKELIIAKRAELKQEFENRREEFKDLNPVERKEAMKQHRQELKDGAEANDIDMKYLMRGPKGGPHHGHGERFGHRMMVD